MEIGARPTMFLATAFLQALVVLFPGQSATGQQKNVNAFFDAGLKTKATYHLPPNFAGSIPGDSTTQSLPFPAVVGLGALAGVGSGFFVGSINNEWTGPDGAGAGAITGALMGVVVGAWAQWGEMNGKRGFLAGAIPGYCLWLLLGAPGEFALDPLFLLAIPGAVAGAFSS